MNFFTIFGAVNGDFSLTPAQGPNPMAQKVVLMFGINGPVFTICVIGLDA